MSIHKGKKGKQKAKKGNQPERAGSSAEEEGNGGAQQCQPLSENNQAAGANRILFQNFTSQFHVTQRENIACLFGTAAKGSTWAVGPGPKGEIKLPRKGLDRGGTHLQEWQVHGRETSRGAMFPKMNGDYNIWAILEVCEPNFSSLGLSTCNGTTGCHG